MLSTRAWAPMGSGSALPGHGIRHPAGIPQPMFQIRHFGYWNLSGIDRRRGRGGRGAAMSKKGIIVVLLALLGLPASMGAALLLHHPSAPSAPAPRIGQIRIEALAPQQ